MVRRRDIRLGLVASPRQAVTALLLHLLPRRHSHVWDIEHCTPAGCVICGRTAR